MPEYIVEINPEVLKLFEEWQEIEGVKLLINEQGRIEVMMTKDVELARFVDDHNTPQNLWTCEWNPTPHRFCGGPEKRPA